MLDPLVANVFDPEEAASLTAELVAFRSYPGEEGPVQRHIAEWFHTHGMTPELQPTKNDRPNVIVRLDNGPGPTLLLNGHTDTVLAVEGWATEPWTPHRDGDRLYGLGAADMKSGVAAAMLAARALHHHRDRWRGTLIFSSVVDEEAYSIGARALIASGLTADYCVVTESAWERPALGSVGKILVSIEVTGKAAHASWPWEGINAASEAAKLVARLDELPSPSHPRMRGSQCVLSFHSGNDQYVITVPEHASIVLNRMIVPGETAETVLQQLQALIDQLHSAAQFNLAVEPPYYPPWETAPDHPLAQALSRACAAETGHTPEWSYAGFGDMNLFSVDAGIPTVMVGPLGTNFHQANEWVAVPSIAATARLLIRLTLDLLPAR